MQQFFETVEKYAKYVNVLSLFGEPIEKFCEQKVGLSLMQARFIMGLLLSMPLGFLLRLFVYKIPRALRSVVSIFIGLQIMWFIYGSQTFFLIFCMVITFLIMKIFPISYSYIVAFVFNVGFMLASHIYIMITAYMSWEPDFTAPLMVLTIKLTSYAFSIHDAYYHQQFLEKKIEDVDLSERQLKYMIEKQPGALDFFGWTFFFPGFFGGPAVEYMDYMRFMDGSMIQDLPGDMKGKIPSCWKQCGIVFVESSLCMFLISFFADYDMNNVRAKLANRTIAVTLPFWKRYLILLAGALLQRCKYYSVWLMGELSSRISGVGFSGMVKDPKTGEYVANWENSVNINPIKFELARNMKEAVDYWNMATERWLRYYCFERLAFTPLKNWKRALTFIFSAFWHGIYPAYYMTFISCAIVRDIAGKARRKLRPYVLDMSKTRPIIHTIYDALSVVCVQNCLNPLFCCFGMLCLHDAFAVFMSTYFCGYWVIILGYIVLPFIPAFKSPQENKGDQKNEETKPKAE